MSEFLSNAITALFAANGLSLEAAGLAVIIIIALMFSIQDYRIGFMALLLGSTVEFIFLYMVGLSYYFSLITIFLAVVLLAFSIFTSRNAGVIA